MSRFFLISVVILFHHVFAVCHSVDISPERNIHFTVQTDQESYGESETIGITLTAHNSSNEQITLTFPCLPYAGYIIEGHFSYLTDYVNVGFGVVMLVDIGPNEEYTWNLHHNPDWYHLTPGVYTLRGEVGFAHVYYATYLLSEPVTFSIINLSAEEHQMTNSEITPTQLRNYPNPFNTETFITFTTQKGFDKLTLIIFNTRGELIQSYTPPQNNFLTGEFRYHWDGTNYRGETAPSGVYYYQIITDSDRKTGKMVLLK